jgi:hypothetical protein
MECGKINCVAFTRFTMRFCGLARGQAVSVQDRPYPEKSPEQALKILTFQKRIRRRMSKVAQLYAHARQQIINLQGSNDLVETACDAVVRRLGLGRWRFIGIKSENATPLKR